MEAHRAECWKIDAVTLRCLDRVRERDAGHLVPHSFEFWLTTNLLEAPLPRIMGCADYALQRMRWNAHLLTMISKKVLELHLGKVDVVLSVEFYLSHCPVPDGGQVIDELFALLFLRFAHSQLELILNHRVLLSRVKSIRLPRQTSGIALTRAVHSPTVSCRS